MSATLIEHEGLAARDWRRSGQEVDSQQVFGRGAVSVLVQTACLLRIQLSKVAHDSPVHGSKVPKEARHLLQVIHVSLVPDVLLDSEEYPAAS